MSINTAYIPLFNLENIFLDKDSGEPLSGGIVTFYEDDQRTTLKPVYQITGTSPSYTFTQLQNPMILSSIGTFVTEDGDPVVPYAYPYASDGTEQLYYITVYSADEAGDPATLQLTREAVPYVPSSDSGGATETSDNAVSNPQFVEVLFEDEGPQVYTVSGSQTTPIAPGWDLITTESGTVTVTRIPTVASTSPSSPSYALTFLSTGFTEAYHLRQRFHHSPRLFANETVGAYLIASCASTTSISATFTPSSGDEYTLIDGVTVVGGAGYASVVGSASIDGTINTESAVTGYVDLIIELPISVTIGISSIQLTTIPSGTSTDEIAFLQEPAARQIDHLFHYYEPALKYKPIPSFLVGWDFPLNPAQFLGDTVAASAIGANKSKYVWDQTIIFQSANSGVGVTRATSGAIVLTAAATTQMALVQYLPQITARKLLNGDLSVNVSAYGSADTDCCVSLWYTTDATLPNAGTTGTTPVSSSLIATIGSSGKPSTFNGNWTEVPRVNSTNSVDAIFSIDTATSSIFNEYPLTGWSLLSNAAKNTATYFAIVVGTSSMTSSATLTINSISLVPGDIATPPAPKTWDETLRECEFYYEKSYDNDVIPGDSSAANIGAGSLSFNQYTVQSGNNNVYASQFQFEFNSVKNSVDPTVRLYGILSDYTAGNVSTFLYLDSVGVVSQNNVVNSFWTETDGGQKGVNYAANTASALITNATAATVKDGFIEFQYTVDGRLGIADV